MILQSNNENKAVVFGGIGARFLYILLKLAIVSFIYKQIHTVYQALLVARPFVAHLFSGCILLLFASCNTKPKYIDIKGIVLDESGTPVPNQKVEALSSYTYKGKTNKEYAYTNNNGEFVFEHFAMAYKDPSLFRKQTNSNLLLVASSDDYQGVAVIATLDQHVTSYYRLLKVSCLATINFSITLNTTILFDKGAVQYERCDQDYTSCGKVYSPISQNGVFDFYPGGSQSFSQKVYADSWHNIFTTRLYKNGVIMKTQVDSFSNLTCKGTTDYTITVN